MPFLFILGGILLIIIITVLIRKGGKYNPKKIREHLQNGQRDKARDLLKKAVHKGTEDPEIHFLLAQVYIFDQNYEYAVVELKLVLKNNVFNHRVKKDEVIRLIVLCYRMLNKFPEAIELLKANRTRTNGILIDYLLGHIHNLSKNYEQSAPYIERVLKLHPNHSPALAEKGIMLFRQGRTDEAVEILEEAIKYDNKNFLAHYFSGECQKKKSQFDKAILSYGRARNNFELKLKSLYHIAECYKAKEMTPSSIEAMEKVISEWDNNPNYSRIYPLEFILEARYQLARSYLDDKDYQNALDQLRLIQELTSDYKDVTSLITTNARFGKDRIQDFLIAPDGEFEKVCIFAIEEYMKLYIINRKYKGKERFVIIARDPSAPSKPPVMIWILRSSVPGTGKEMNEIKAAIESGSYSLGIVLSPSGFSPQAIKAILGEATIKIIGKSQFTKILKLYENRFREKKSKS